MATSTSKKFSYWPVCTTLLILCPDILNQVVSSSKEGTPKENQNKEKFLEDLQKSIKVSKLTAIGCICYVDICKASTYVSKTDASSGLRHILPSIESELKEIIFNSQNLQNLAPTKKSENIIIEEGIMVDFLFSLFYLSPRKIANSLLLDCMKSSNPLFKKIFLNTLLKVARDKEKKLSWNPTISDIYNIHSPNIRQLFQEMKALLNEHHDFHSLQISNIQLLNSININNNRNDRRNNVINASNMLSSNSGIGSNSIASAPLTSSSKLHHSVDKKQKQQMEKVQQEVELLIKLIKLIQFEPNLAIFFNKSNPYEIDEIRQLLSGLCDCIVKFELPLLSEVAIQSLLEFHKLMNLNEWINNDLNHFWILSSSILIHLTTFILFSASTSSTTPSSSTHIGNKNIYKLICLLESILQSRNEYLSFKLNLLDTTGQEGSTSTTPSSNPSAQTSSNPSSLNSKSNSIEYIKAIQLKASNKLETILLLQLGSSNMDLLSKSINCIKLLCNEIELRKNDDLQFGNEFHPFLIHYVEYKQLTDTGILSTGRQAQQKAIRNILQKIERTTTGNFNAWNEIYARWHNFTVLVKLNEEKENLKKEENNKDSKKKSKPVQVPDYLQKFMNDLQASDILLEWTNYLGILCSLSGVIINYSGNASNPHSQPLPSPSVSATPTTTASPQSSMTGNTMLHSSISSSSYRDSISILHQSTNSGSGTSSPAPARHSIKSPPSLPNNTAQGSTANLHSLSAFPTASSGSSQTYDKLDEFLYEVMDLLVCEYINIRETVKLMIGGASSFSLLGKLFHTIYQQCKRRLFQESGQILSTADSILFTDQIVSIIKLIFEGHNNFLLVNDIEDLILLLIKFTRQLTIQLNSLQIKLKLCSVIEILMKKRNLFSFKNEFQFRSDLIENLIEWTSEFSTKESNIPIELPLPILRQINKLIKELGNLPFLYFPPSFAFLFISFAFHIFLIILSFSSSSFLFFSIN